MMLRFVWVSVILNLHSENKAILSSQIKFVKITLQKHKDIRINFERLIYEDSFISQLITIFNTSISTRLFNKEFKIQLQKTRMSFPTSSKEVVQIIGEKALIEGDDDLTLKSSDLEAYIDFTNAQNNEAILEGQIEATYKNLSLYTKDKVFVRQNNIIQASNLSIHSENPKTQSKIGSIKANIKDKQIDFNNIQSTISIKKDAQLSLKCNIMQWKNEALKTEQIAGEIKGIKIKVQRGMGSITNDFLFEKLQVEAKDGRAYAEKAIIHIKEKQIIIQNITLYYKNLFITIKQAVITNSSIAKLSEIIITLKNKVISKTEKGEFNLETNEFTLNDSNFHS